MSGRHVREQSIVDYTRRTGNGIPHLAYSESGISFVWTGHPSDPIEVEVGGYGEPVTHVITTRVDGTPLALALEKYVATVESPSGAGARYGHVVTHWYAHICSEWVKVLDEGGPEPQRVREVRP